MATAYEARVPLRIRHDGEDTRRAVVRALDDPRFRLTDTGQTVDASASIVVDIRLDAADAADVQIEARELVVRALRIGGLPADVVDVGDVDVRSSS